MKYIVFLAHISEILTQKQNSANHQFNNNFQTILDNHIQLQSLPNKIKKIHTKQQKPLKYLSFDQTNSKVKNHNTKQNISIFQQISRKNINALNEFIQKFNQIEIETQQIKQNPKEFKQNKHAQKVNKSNIQKVGPLNIHKYTLNYDNEKSQQKIIKCQRKQDIQTNFTPYKQKLKVYTQDSHNQKPFQNPENKQQQIQKTASQILAELEQMHKHKSLQKSQKNLHKSVNMRTKVIKMKPQMVNQMKQKKQKQAQIKMKINIEFLQSLKIKPTKQVYNFKEFKNQSLEIQKLKQSIRIKTIKKSRHINFNETQKQSYQLVNSKKQKYSIFDSNNFKDSNIFLDSPLKLPPIEQTKGGIKPKPYSVYNVYQKSNEMFINSPSKLF